MNILLMLFLIVPKSIANINLLTGGLEYRVEDQFFGGVLGRTFFSRSLHKGILGKGWCSDLEIEINVEDKVVQCHGSIVSEYKRGKLKSNEKGYSWLFEGGVLEFDKKRKLIRLEKRGTLLIVSRSPFGQAVSLVTKKGFFDLSYTSDGLLARITHKSREVMDWEYHDDLLIRAGKNSYNYDAFDNLIQSDSHRWLYDELDRVVLVTSAGCIENYRWLSSAKNREEVIVYRRCGRKSQEKHISFIFREETIQTVVNDTSSGGAS
ncbi:MAG: hypothetical protein N2578_02205 [Bdellovibrionaceae bacterium]|nr:hypothetical protein [Pseudobdellovibrionaceae bacterium]